MKNATLSVCIISISMFSTAASAHNNGLPLPDGMRIGCGGYVNPVFPASAGRDYKKTCWVARVKKDQFTDAVSCSIYPAGTSYDAYPYIFVHKDGVTITVAGGDRYPGTPVMIRVDKHPAISSGKFFSNSSVHILLDEMAHGVVIRARYSDWPYNTYRDGIMDAKGIAEAIDYCRSHVK